MIDFMDRDKIKYLQGFYAAILENLFYFYSYCIRTSIIICVHTHIQITIQAEDIDVTNNCICVIMFNLAHRAYQYRHDKKA